MVFITLWAVTAVAFCLFVFVLQYYLRIILNLFLNVQIKAEPNQPVEMDGREIAFESSDGVRLVGRLLPARGGEAHEVNGRAPAVIFCHEFGSNHQSVAEYAAFLRDEGLHVFTFDFSNHGESETRPDYTPRHWASVYELNDLLGAIDCVAGLPEVDAERLGLFGISRGASTAICASELRPVRFVISDGAFSTHQILENYMQKWVSIYGVWPSLYRHYPTSMYRALRWMTIRLSKFRLGYRFLNLAERLKDVSTPILFIHGERDTYIKADHARWLHRIYRGPKQLFVAPKARHNEAVRLHPVDYHRRVAAFVTAHTGLPAPQPTSTEAP